MTSSTIPHPMLLRLDQITLDERVWPRERLDSERVEMFMELVREAREAAGSGQGWSDPLPPLAVVADGRGGYLLADGRHRYEARRRLGRGFEQVGANVVMPNGQAPAQYAYEIALYTATVSAKPLTTAEKRAAILRLLDERPDLSDRAIARLVGVGNATVSGYHQALRKAGVEGGAEGVDVPWRSDPRHEPLRSIFTLLRYGEPFALDDDRDESQLEDELRAALHDQYPTHAADWATWWAKRFQAAA